MTINHYTGEGRVFEEPKFSKGKETEKSDFAAFTMAVSQGKTKQGEYRKSLYLKCKAWSWNARVIRDNVRPGVNVVVSGRLVPDEYTLKDGSVRRSIEVVVEDIAVYTREGRGQAKAKPTQELEVTPSDQDTLFGDEEQEAAIPF